MSSHKLLHLIQASAQLNLYTMHSYSEPSQTSKMDLFFIIVNDFQPLTIFAKKFMLHWVLNKPLAIVAK